MEQICLPRQSGGLAVRNLKTFIEDLLEKWLWRYGSEREALWQRISEGKYESLVGGWSTKVVNGPYAVSLWKYIRNGWDKFHALLSSKLVMVLELNFGLTFGVVKLLLRIFFLSCIILPRT